jgi:acyl-CoA reductase-like NAD-dependent aldehyde dehydrogenase
MSTAAANDLALEHSAKTTGSQRIKSKYFHPTIIQDVTMAGTFLSEELFGPILPIMKCDQDTAIETINSMPRPLGLYVFSRQQSEIKRILESTIPGGVTVNDVAIHNDVHSAPFGALWRRWRVWLWRASRQMGL